MNIETAKTLQRGEWLHHESQTQSGNQCFRVRVNGVPQTWKTRPNDVRVPVRWGMRARDQFSLHNEELREWERESECRNDSHPKPVDSSQWSGYHTHRTDDDSVSWSHANH